MAGGTTPVTFDSLRQVVRLGNGERLQRRPQLADLLLQLSYPCILLRPTSYLCMNS